MSPRPAFLAPDVESEILAGARGARSARERALARLLDELGEPLHALCLHVTGRPEEAVAAVAEAFGALGRSLPGLGSAPRLSAYAFRIALRAAFQARARRGESAAETGVGGDAAERLQSALARLPGEPRAVLALFAVEGLAPGEAALVLGIPEEDAWARLHAARRVLESVLRPTG